jgi:hypothetical protein
VIGVPCLRPRSVVICAQPEAETACSVCARQERKTGAMTAPFMRVSGGPVGWVKASHRGQLLASTAIFVSLLLLTGCGGGGGAAPASSQSETPTAISASPVGAGSEPVGIIAIGHSALTGESSDPRHPGLDAPKNSWATGTNPKVNSIYLRLTRLRPETKGHVANTARGGATSAQLPGQAQLALSEVPNPALVIIETIDNDIQCDGTDAENTRLFGKDVADTLKMITDASPKSRILIVGQPGRPSAKVAEAEAKRDPAFKAEATGTGICSFFTDDGRVNTKGIATLTRIIEGYEAEQARVCRVVPECATDKGASIAYQEDYRERVLGHLNVHGLARIAALFWPSAARLMR